jgi:hypothetical protein
LPDLRLVLPGAHGLDEQRVDSRATALERAADQLHDLVQRVIVLAADRQER